MASGADTHTHIHTHTHTYIRTEVISRNQARAGRRPARAWFKNMLTINEQRNIPSIGVNKNSSKRGTQNLHVMQTGNLAV